MLQAFWIEWMDGWIDIQVKARLRGWKVRHRLYISDEGFLVLLLFCNTNLEHFVHFFNENMPITHYSNNVNTTPLTHVLCVERGFAKNITRHK